MDSKYVELPPDPARVIEGLRDTGYSFTTSIADIVDNSIEAGASRIGINIATDLLNQPVVTIVDNGCGMNQDELVAAMQYGSARNAVRRLSKFGLGLKTASTAFSRRLLVTSRSVDMVESAAAWDLDIIVERGEWLLEQLEPEALDTDFLNAISPNSSGTVVRWEKIDRLLSERAANGSPKKIQNAMDRQVDALHEHLGLVFQRYLQLWNGRQPIEMTINDKVVVPIDPFCNFEPNTQKLIDMTKGTMLPSGGQSSFEIRGYVIPPKGGYTSPDNQADARISNETQGIYVYREDRLIHGPDWMRFVKQEPHFSLARIEFSFGQELDEAFNVDIKKSRIELSETIADYIKDKVMPPIRSAANDIYRGARAKDVGTASKGLHDSSNSVLASKGQDIQGVSIESIDLNSGVAVIQNPTGMITIDIGKEENEEQSALWIRTTDSIDDGLLWKPTVTAEHVAVELNTSHLFYERVYMPSRNSNVVQSFDYLLWALANAELYVTSDTHRKVFLELRYEASKRLRALADELPEVKIEGFDEE
jgi:Histidine kinase-, DNA gyrase B-, and HSP90-like ATPase